MFSFLTSLFFKDDKDRLREYEENAARQKRRAEYRENNKSKNNSSDDTTLLAGGAMLLSDDTECDGSDSDGGDGGCDFRPAYRPTTFPSRLHRGRHPKF